VLIRSEFLNHYGTLFGGYMMQWSDDMAYNDPGKKPVVKFSEKPLKEINDQLEIAPVSATIFKFKVR